MCMYILDARALLENVTPLPTDCGAYCGGACCKPDEDGQGGVLLFPGEKALYENIDWAQMIETPEGGALYCKCECPRDMRPMGCRLFPLTPVKRKDGNWDVRVDRRAFAMCPLAPSGVKALDPAFVDRARQAVNLLARDPQTEAFLRRWAKQERSYASPL